jgi:asparagine synthase (glutamine-hydrolysing)
MPNQDKMVIDLERFVWFQETPTNGPGPFSEWCVAELAASSVKVVLSGQGADEMLGGYHYFYEPYFKTRLKELLINHGNGLSDLWREIICVSEMTGMPFWYYLSYMLMPYPEQILHLGKRVIRDKLFLREFRTKGKKLCSEQHDLPDGATLLDRRLSDSILGWGLSRLLHYLDRNSMAFSLEARVPFLDHRLVEYCLGLPYYWKIQGVSTKHVLREAMSDILPKSIIERRDKKGFETPLAGWLHASQQWVRDLLSNQSFIKRGIFDPKQIELTLNNFFNEVNKKGLGRRTYSWEIWRMIQLELWFMLFLDA